MSELSATMRDYLAEIYRLADRHSASPYVNTSALADVLNVSAPAVNRMVARLKDIGLLEHEPYQGIRLTPAGQQEALKRLRAHRIAEVFLVQVMGFGWHEVYDEAQRISGALGEPLIQRMYEMAGSPVRCPHGEPIPDAAGTLPPRDDLPLAHAAQGSDLTITRIRTREPDRLEYLAALGLTPGTRLHLLHVAPFNGPLQLRMGQSPASKEFRIVGHNLAEMVFVHPAETTVSPPFDAKSAK